MLPGQRISYCYIELYNGIISETLLHIEMYTEMRYVICRMPMGRNSANIRKSVKQNINIKVVN